MRFKNRQTGPTVADAESDSREPTGAADAGARSHLEPKAPPSEDPAETIVPRSARELAELAQALAEQAAVLREQWQELADALAAGTAAPALPPLRPPAALPREEAGSGQDPVQLVALSMAAAHSSRREIEDYLRTRLGVEDSRELLDSIFGPVGTEVTEVTRRRRGLFARTSALGDDSSDELAEAQDET